jgi:hypothetical protein
MHAARFDPGDTALRHQVLEVHAMIGWIVLGVAG